MASNRTYGPDMYEVLCYVGAIAALLIGAATGSVVGQTIGFFAALALCLGGVCYFAAKSKKQAADDAAAAENK